MYYPRQLFFFQCGPEHQKVGLLCQRIRMLAPGKALRIRAKELRLSTGSRIGNFWHTKH